MLQWTLGWGACTQLTLNIISMSKFLFLANISMILIVFDNWKDNIPLNSSCKHKELKIRWLDYKIATTFLLVPALFGGIVEDYVEKEMAPHSSTLAWRIPWMEEPGRLWSMGSQRVGHDWVTELTDWLTNWYHICFSLSDLYYAVWQSLGPSTSLQKILHYSLHYFVPFMAE